MPRLLTYVQATGEVAYIAETEANPATPEVLAHGWAGNGPGKNNPQDQNLHDIGPLPVGGYWIGGPINHPHLGPLAMRLNPDAANQMYGRDGFYIHGASKDPKLYGQESKGCIILPREIRQKIIDLGVKRLEVRAYA